MATKIGDSVHPRFHFIGGKGGVGKTTCAASLAVAAARSGSRVLVVSTDPAPSLGDALKMPLSGTPHVVSSASGRLYAVEIDAVASLNRWLDERRAILEDIAVQGTWLDRDDVERLLRLSLPGIDELAALLEIDRLAHVRRYDLVVVDTAPTGHTLRMLAMPETLMGVSRVFDRMREKQRVVQEALRGARTDGPEDRLIDELAHTSQRLHGMLRDASRTKVEWVTLAEPLAVAETTDAIESLNAAGILVRTIIVNRITPAPPSRCGHCDARRSFEAISVRSLRALGANVYVTARDGEPRGIRALGSIAAEMQREAELTPAPVHARPWGAKLTGRSIGPAKLLLDSTKLVLLGGKGGVGKTTCAAAVALSASRRWPGRRVLLLSTDPAHSLSDVFAQELGDRPSAVAGGPSNLRVREMNAGKVLTLLQQEYAEAIDRLFDRLRGQSAFDASHDRAVMRTLIDLAPPGLDELAAVLDITTTLGDDPPEGDLVVMDTAPTGHALRLLEMPALIHDWTHALMSILLKYQGVTPLGEIGAMLVRLSKGIRGLRELLADPEQTMFIAVTRSAALPRLETARLVSRLDALGISLPAVIANGVGRGTCGRCVKAAAVERVELAALRRSLLARTTRSLIVTPTVVPAPRGAARIAAWSRLWRDPAPERTRTRAISSTR